MLSTMTTLAHNFFDMNGLRNVHSVRSQNDGCTMYLRLPQPRAACDGGCPRSSRLHGMQVHPPYR